MTRRWSITGWTGRSTCGKPSTRRRANDRWFVALLLPLASVATAASALPERANYFTSGFTPAFDAFLELTGLVKACQTRFTAGCGRRMDETAPGLRWIVEIVPLITVFDSRAFDTEKELTEPDVGARMAAARDRFNRGLLDFDKDLLQRYRALVSVCPYQKADFIPATLDIAFPRYWSLSAPAYAQIKRDIQIAADRSAQQIRGWPKERCVAARNYGAIMLYGLELRLKRYAGADWVNVPPGTYLDDAATQVLITAIGFEETVHPDIMKEVEKRKMEFEKKKL